MINPARYIQKIFIAEDCRDLPHTARILKRAANIPVQEIKGHQLPGLSTGDHYHHQLTAGKRNLLLCRNQGHFLKPCPGTREYRCCEYQILNIGMNCPMDCVYCILQAYLNNPWLTFFVNTEDLLIELKGFLAAEPQRFWRIGTGEFTYRMALDQLTGLGAILSEFMADQTNAVLELKTKSAMIDNLANVDHKGRTIMAWSLNSPAIMQKEELRTATLDERLAAAARCAAWGYKLAFHFDPIIYHQGWRQGYAETIERLFATVPASQIVWISMGALRFLPTLKQIAADRFPNSSFFFEEFVMGLDGKNRYFRPHRVEMYKYIYNLLQAKASPETCIYFCMESDEIWQEVMGFTPEEHGGLPAMLERTVSGGVEQK